MVQTFAFEDLKRILTDRIGVPEEYVSSDPATRLDELGLDSLAFVEVQLAMQQEYGVLVEEEEVEQITTVGEAVAYVNTRLAQQEV